METYSASLDTASKILTGFIFLMLIGGIIMSLILDPWYSGLIVSVVPALLILCLYPYRVVSYQITDEKLIIDRPFSMFNKEILLSDIESARLLTKEDFKWTIRTAGNGGLFGYTGYYANTKLGSFRMYATNGKNKLLIILKGKKDKIVISPDDASMIESLLKHLRTPLIHH